MQYINAAKERLVGFVSRLIPPQLVEPYVEFEYTQLQNGAHVATFPREKMFFPDGARGSNGYDLSNAFALGVVISGDVLEITSAFRPPDEKGNGTKLIYMEPDSPLFGGMDGTHKFIPERPYEGMPEVLMEGMISSWKRVGHVTEDEWNSMMKETFGDRVIEPTEV